MQIAIGERQRGPHNRLSGDHRPLGRGRLQSASIGGEDARSSISRFRIETICTIALLFYTTGAVVPLITGGADQAGPLPGPPTPLALAIKLAIYASALVAIARWWPIIVPCARRIKWILAPILIAVGSIVWSQDVPLTLRSISVLVATTVFGIYFGVRYTVPQQLQLLVRVFSLVIVLSVMFAIFLPGYGIDQGSTAGDWRGVFPEKNGLAEAMVLAFFVFLFFRPERRASLRWLGLVASLVLLFLSKSATGVIVCIAVLAVLPFYQVARARFTLAIPVGLGFVMLLAGFALIVNDHAAKALEMFGRSPDLTGRTELWKAVTLAIARRPWLGYGFSAFWRGMKGPSGAVLESAGWMAGYAHNGFLDLMLQLGAVGLVTYIGGYLFLWQRAIRLLRRSAGMTPMWLCSFLLFTLLYNLTEGTILSQDSICWLLYISTAVSILAPYPNRSRLENGINEHEL